MKKLLCNLIAFSLSTIHLTAIAGSFLDSYWPLNNGDQKTFEIAEVVPVTESVSNLGSGQFQLLETFGGSTQTLFLQEDGDDCYLTGAQQIEVSPAFDPPVLLLDDNILEKGGTVRTATTVYQQGTSYPATFTITVGKAGTITVPAGTFANCRSITSSERAVVPGQGVVTKSALTAVLAPGVGIVKTLILPGIWAEFVGGTIAGVPIGQQDFAEFTLQINGGGAVQIKGINGPVTGDNILLLQNGKSYTMTAKDLDGAVFDGWADDNGNSLGTAPELTFTMQDNLVLQANFIPNPFADAAGKYIGLFMPDDGNTVQNSGFVSLNVVNNGAFSGYLQTGVTRHTLSGQFDANGDYTNTISFSDDTTVTVGLSLSVPGGVYLNGTVTAASWTAQLSANQLYNGKVLYSLTGLYTVLFTDGYGDSEGSGAMNFTKSGPTTLTGKLANGPQINASSTFSALDEDADWPFYTALDGGRGCFLGWMYLGPGSISGNFLWVQPSGNVVQILASGQPAP